MALCDKCGGSGRAWKKVGRKLSRSTACSECRGDGRMPDRIETRGDQVAVGAATLGRTDTGRVRMSAKLRKRTPKWPPR